MNIPIPYNLKVLCVEARKTKTQKQVYDDVFYPIHKTMAFNTFRHKLKKWEKQQMADNETLSQGTYEGFTAHKATVQVDGAGNIRQAWIKQAVDDNQFEQILDAIKDNICAVEIDRTTETSEAMLEIPLFDMHFGVATFNDYKKILGRILNIISTNKWEEINIIVGQDLLHTNDFRGNTAKGTQIGKIDFGKAWRDAWDFWCIVIEKALEESQKLHIRYSKGNHDECTSWCFVKALEAKYQQAMVDDSFKPRRCIFWNGCFIGYGHCEYRGSLADLFQDFVLDFPTEFAQAKVREIHTGHLHSESQDKGMMIRRLSSAVPTDEWSDDNGYVGAHKRFQIFEWGKNKLKAIYYV